MLPKDHVWIFNGVGGRFPAGAFTTLDLAEQWIREQRLTGALTAYPLDEGTFDWAVRNRLVTESVTTRGSEPAFVGSFSAAAQEHHHYENGVPTSSLN